MGKLKFEFEDQESYYLERYGKELREARNYVENQLMEANRRFMEHKQNMCLFGGIALGSWLILPIGLLMGISGGLMGAFTVEGALVGGIGCILVFIDIPLLIFVFPFAVIRAVHGFTAYSICKPNLFGMWLHEHFKIDLCTKERSTCKDYLQKYDILLKELDLREADYHLNGKSDFSDIKERMEQIGTKPNIPIEQSNYGDVKRISNRVAIGVLIITYCILAVIFVKCEMVYYNTMVELFRSI